MTRMHVSANSDVPPPEQWGGLMEAAQAGDGDAYRRLLRALLPYLRGYARRHLRDSAAAEDLVQDILLTLHRVRHTYDPARPLQPWLSVIARHRLIDAYRALRRAPLAVEDMEMGIETFVDSEAYRKQGQLGEAAALRRLIDELPERQRRAIELLKMEERSLKEVSVITGMSTTALKVTTHRALKALRRRMRKEPGSNE